MAVMLLVVAGAASTAEDRPNLIVIMADDLGYGDLGCYDGWIKTPHLDRLAARGVRFTDYHSSCPVCSPTRAALLTGRYQQRAGLPQVVTAGLGGNHHHGLQSSELTFAEVLHDAGYATGIMGKWHLGYGREYNPVHQGFDVFRGYVSGNIDFHSHFDRIGTADWWHNAVLTPEEGYTTHLISRHAVEFIHANRDEPFCLYVAHEAPHDPYQGPNDPAIRVEGKTVPEVYPPGHVRRAYREMVEELDQGVGEVVAALEETGLSENTFLLFISDNGATPEGSNAPLHGFKTTLWEGGHRVPAIACWPGHIRPGRVTDQTAMTIDVMPTLLELSGTPVPAGHQLDGVSLAGVLLEGRPLEPRTLFWDYNGRQAARRGPWKLLVGEPDGTSRETAESSPALYRLADDLGEMHDVSQQFHRRAAVLSQALAAWQKDVATGATVQPEKAQPQDARSEKKRQPGK